jgi:tetraprenyl-beta-curcumene synthase
MPDEQACRWTTTVVLSGGMSLWRGANPTPITAMQVRALLGAATRELSWGLGEVAREIRIWRQIAEAIPDSTLREDALFALDNKRAHADGAALFSVLPDHRDPNLVGLLVAYETILDYLDEVSERYPTEANGRELHLALFDALDPEREFADYYRYHPWVDDGGYLPALVERCRDACRQLPSYGVIRTPLAREVRRTQVLALNHLVDPVERDAALRQWAASEFPDERELHWFELGAAASASLVVHSLLALAARPTVSADEIAVTYATYWPWTSLATAMLDSYVDQAEDEERGNHSYIAHYDEPACAISRLRECIAAAARGAFEPSNGHRHAVIVCAMVAMYLSKDSARSPKMRRDTTMLVTAGGSLARLLLPMLRAWRLAYSQRAA